LCYLGLLSCACGLGLSGGAFFTAAFLAGAFFTAAFLAGAFFTAAFLAGAFFTAAFLAGAFFTAAFLAEVFFFAAGTMDSLRSSRYLYLSEWYSRMILT